MRKEGKLKHYFRWPRLDTKMGCTCVSGNRAWFRNNAHRSMIPTERMCGAFKDLRPGVLRVVGVALLVVPASWRRRRFSGVAYGIPFKPRAAAQSNGTAGGIAGGAGASCERAPMPMLGRGVRTAP